MGVPSSQFIWDDQTIKAPAATTNTLAGKPVIMTVCSSDKGPEEYRTFDKEYIERYGNISFAKHGQAQLQLYRILQAEGAVYHKRVVAPDSTLANMSLVATTTQVSEHKVDNTGARLYRTPEGEETTAAEGNEPIMINKAGIKYDIVVIDDLPTLIKLGNNPRAIAEMVKKNIELENSTAVNPDIPVVERDTPDDLSTMGHADITVNLTVSDVDGDGVDDYKANVTVTCDASQIARIAMLANNKVVTISDFTMENASVSTTDAPGTLVDANVELGDNTLYVEYVDSVNYPAELYLVNIAEGNVVTTSTLLDKSDLKAIVKAAQAIVNEDYTEESWSAFTIALTNAALTLDDSKNAQQVSDARVELKYFMESLVTNKVATSVPKKFLLFTITDTGRGESAKRITITPNYRSSKNAKYTKYFLSVLEGTDSTDRTLMFSMNPDIIDTGKNRRLDSVLTAQSMQLRGVVYENELNMFYDDIASKCGESTTYLKEHDILFGYTRMGKPLDCVVISKASVSLNSMFGVPLKGGTNGSFGSFPMNSPLYYEEVKKAYDGTNIEIYDLDNVDIYAIFDANWPVEVKHAIESLVTFREDCFYFRDLGIGLQNYNDIASADDNMLKSKFCASYHNSYDVFDDFTRKQITVTCMYHLAPMFVTHYSLGVNRPFAGYLHGMIFDDVIEGTVNYIPVKCPGDDQPTELYNLNVNYMKYYQQLLTLETERTSQEVESELSYINNVIAIQEVIRAVRRRCPKIRYTFKEGDDFVKYQKDINQVLEKFSGFFTSLNLVYLEDMAQTDPKCYFAAIQVDAKDFIESEYFKVSVVG